MIFEWLSRPLVLMIQFHNHPVYLDLTQKTSTGVAAVFDDRRVILRLLFAKRADQAIDISEIGLHLLYLHPFIDHSNGQLLRAI
jgi:hypothetical protein